MIITFMVYAEIGKEELKIPTVGFHKFFGVKEGEEDEIETYVGVEVGRATLEKLELGEKPMVIATPTEGELITPVLFMEGGETAILTELPGSKITAECEFYGETVVGITYSIEIPEELEKEYRVLFPEKEEVGALGI